MSVLDDLKPISKLRVIDLVREAGVDVSDWSNLRGGKKKAAVTCGIPWTAEEPTRSGRRQPQFVEECAISLTCGI
jgi:hypothetical protein